MGFNPNLPPLNDTTGADITDRVTDEVPDASEADDADGASESAAKKLERYNNKDAQDNDVQAFEGLIEVVASRSIVPVGTVVPWTGSGTPPEGWTVCDGTNPSGDDALVPDLRNKFLVGEGNNTVGTTGGSASVTLSESELPSHDHPSSGNISVNANDNFNISVSANTNAGANHNLNASANANSDTNVNAGGNLSGNIDSAGSHDHNYITTFDSGSIEVQDPDPNKDTSVRKADQGNYYDQTDFAGSHSHNDNYNVTVNADADTDTNASASVSGNVSANASTNASGNIDGNISVSGGGNYSVGTTGSGDAHENRPPYYTVKYIIKIAGLTNGGSAI